MLPYESSLKKTPLHIYRGANSVSRIGEAVRTGTAGVVLVGGGAGMNSDVSQTVHVCLNVVEQSHTQSQLNNAAAMSDLQSFTASQFRILNNNIRCYGGSIQGSLVRQRASNRGRTIARAEAPYDESPSLVEATPATLSNNPKTLMCLWREYKFGLNGRKPAETFTTYEKK